MSLCDRSRYIIWQHTEGAKTFTYTLSNYSSSTKGSINVHTVWHYRSLNNSCAEFFFHFSKKKSRHLICSHLHWQCLSYALLQLSYCETRVCISRLSSLVQYVLYQSLKQLVILNHADFWSDPVSWKLQSHNWTANMIASVENKLMRWLF